LLSGIALVTNMSCDWVSGCLGNQAITAHTG